MRASAKVHGNLHPDFHGSGKLIGETEAERVRRGQRSPCPPTPARSGPTRTGAPRRPSRPVLRRAGPGVCGVANARPRPPGPARPAVPLRGPPCGRIRVRETCPRPPPRPTGAGSVHFYSVGQEIRRGPARAGGGPGRMRLSAVVRGAKMTQISLPAGPNRYKLEMSLVGRGTWRTWRGGLLDVLLRRPGGPRTVHCSISLSLSLSLSLFLSLSLSLSLSSLSHTHRYT